MVIREAASAARTDLYPENPVLVRLWRAGRVESVHRGAWVLTDAAGGVLDGAGAYDEPFFARSSVKAFQAVPLLESGAAERFAFSDEELALALASHGGERRHTERVARTLARLGLGVGHLRCGAHAPTDAGARAELEARGEAPSALHNNCSGKHAAFLALALHLGASSEEYLAPESDGQRLVRRSLSDFTDLGAEELGSALDGCSAPTFRLPLRRLAMAFARMTSPEGLAPARRAICRRITAAAGAHPELVAADQKRLCTELLRATGGRIFPKVGAEGVYALGVLGGQRGLALKIDDGQGRGLHLVVLALLEQLGLVDARELERLAAWRETVIRNHAGLEVGRVEPVLHG
jgi:L-asparaginase II